MDIHNVCGLRPFIVYLPCFRCAGGQYPTSLLMLVVTVVLLLFKEKSEGAYSRPSEHPPVRGKNVVLSRITASKESGPWSQIEKNTRQKESRE